MQLTSNATSCFSGSLHGVCSICTVIPWCALYASSTITVDHKPFNIITYKNSLSSNNFPALYPLSIFKNLFFSLAGRNYTIYMNMSISIACGVGIWTEMQPYNYDSREKVKRHNTLVCISKAYWSNCYLLMLSCRLYGVLNLLHHPSVDANPWCGRFVASSISGSLHDVLLLHRHPFGCSVCCVIHRSQSSAYLNNDISIFILLI